MLENIVVKYLITFFLGMMPIIEIRGAIPVGVGLGLTYIQAFLIGFVGNIIPIYFIVKYIGPVFDFLGRFKIFRIIIDWVTNKATNKIKASKRLQNCTAIGLYLFVAIPIPGTGAWVGSLIANMLGIPIKKAIPPLVLGVITAGIIVLAATGSVVTIFNAVN